MSKKLISVALTIVSGAAVALTAASCSSSDSSNNNGDGGSSSSSSSGGGNSSGSGSGSSGGSSSSSGGGSSSGGSSSSSSGSGGDGGGDAGFLPPCIASAAGQTAIDDQSAPTGTQIKLSPTFTPAACGMAGTWFDYPMGMITPSPFTFSSQPTGIPAEAGVTVSDAAVAEGGIAGPRAVCVSGVTGASQYSTSGVGLNFATTPAPDAGVNAQQVPLNASSHTGIQFWAWGGGDAGTQSVFVSLADLNETAGFGPPTTPTATGQLCNGGTDGVGTGATACGGARTSASIASGWQLITIAFTQFTPISGFGSANEAALDPSTLTQLQWQIQQPVADAAAGVPYNFCIYGVSFY
jgi:hypothetical protein